MNQVSTQAPQSEHSSTVFLVPWLRSARDSMIREGDQWILRQDLNPTQRTAVQNLVASLKSRLACGPSDAKARLIELAKLMAAFPAFQDGEIQTKLRMEAYATSLDGVPAWAVSEAREAIIKGQFGSVKYVPSPSEFASAARSRMRTAENDLAELTRIIGAKVEQFAPPPEERLRVVEGFKALRKTLGSKAEEITREQAREGLAARCDELGIPPEVIDSIPDAPIRTASFRPLKRGEAA